jgi:hypothetical protein
MGIYIQLPAATTTDATSVELTVVRAGRRSLEDVRFHVVLHGAGSRGNIVAGEELAAAAT